MGGDVVEALILRKKSAQSIRKKYNTVYCGGCMERAVCTRCWNSNHHVRMASHRVAIDVKDIREFLDISNIQVHIINHKTIMFLNPDVQGAAAKEHPKYPTCLTCCRRLVKSDCGDNHYKFCSIACKSGSKEDETKKYEEEIIEREHPRTFLKLKRKNIESSSPSSLSPRSPRKRSRKGIPHRAPLQ